MSLVIRYVYQYFPFNQNTPKILIAASLQFFKHCYPPEALQLTHQRNAPSRSAKYKFCQCRFTEIPWRKPWSSFLNSFLQTSKFLYGLIEPRSSAPRRKNPQVFRAFAGRWRVGIRARRESEGWLKRDPPREWRLSVGDSAQLSAAKVTKYPEAPFSANSATLVSSSAATPPPLPPPDATIHRELNART